MKTKFQKLGSLATVLVFVSVQAFAGDPTGSAVSGNASNSILSVNNTNSTQSLLSYHHGGGGGDDGIEGKNMVYGGVGFLSLTGLMASVYTSAGYSVSHIPNIDLGYERGVSEHWGVGAIFSYSSLNFNLDNQTGDPYYNGGNAYTYSDKLSVSTISFGATFNYHFRASDKVDPYYGIGLGYQSISASWTTTDPNTAIDGNIEPGAIKGAGFMFQTYFGCRFYFTNNIGAWVDFGWHGLTGSLLNLGIVAKF